VPQQVKREPFEQLDCGSLCVTPHFDISCIIVWARSEQHLRCSRTQHYEDSTVILPLHFLCDDILVCGQSSFDTGDKVTVTGIPSEVGHRVSPYNARPDRTGVITHQVEI
jgi:hypothetical protein